MNNSTQELCIPCQTFYQKLTYVPNGNENQAITDKHIFRCVKMGSLHSHPKQQIRFLSV